MPGSPSHRTLRNGMRAAVACLALGAAPASLADASTTPGEVDLVMVGDVMLAETPGELIARGVDPFAAMATLLPESAIRIANLECVIATGGTAEVKPYTFRAAPATIAVLQRHFDAVSVANNHSGDFGKAAFAEQLGDGRLIVPTGLHLLPCLAKINDGPANIEFFEDEALNETVTHFSCSV